MLPMVASAANWKMICCLNCLGLKLEECECYVAYDCLDLLLERVVVLPILGRLNIRTVERLASAFSWNL